MWVCFVAFIVSLKLCVLPGGRNLAQIKLKFRLNRSRPVVFYNTEVFISVYKHNINLSSASDNLILVNYMA